MLHYFDIYHRHFAGFRRQPLTIVGVDINPECQQFSEPRIDIVIGDQGDRACLRLLADRHPDFAILVDDGRHRIPAAQTFIESVKSLIDRLNAFYGTDQSQFSPDEFTRTTDSLHFYTMCIGS